MLDKTTDFSNLLKELSKKEILFIPGSNFEYSSINYVLLGQIIQQVTNESFIKFIDKICSEINITCLASDTINPKIIKTIGYKIGFTRSFPYNAPNYPLNYSGGYMMLNIKDMAQWLKFQIGINCEKDNTGLKLATCITQTLNQSLLLAGLQENYAMGWFIDNEDISNTGLNPNFSSYIAINRTNKVGVVILANTNSLNTYKIGDYIFNKLKKVNYFSLKEYESFATIDQISSICFIALLIYTIFLILGIRKMYLKYNYRLNISRFNKSQIIIILIVLISILLTFYFGPLILLGVYWKTLYIWMPISFVLGYWLTLLSILLTILFYFVKPKRSPVAR